MHYIILTLNRGLSLVKKWIFFKKVENKNYFIEKKETKSIINSLESQSLKLSLVYSNFVDFFWDKKIVNQPKGDPQQQTDADKTPSVDNKIDIFFN